MPKNNKGFTGYYTFTTSVDEKEAYLKWKVLNIMFRDIHIGI